MPKSHLLKSKDLLFKLTALEGELNAFSFEELKVHEANSLKKAFTHFKWDLQNHLSSTNSSSTTDFEEQPFIKTHETIRENPREYSNYLMQLEQMICTVNGDLNRVIEMVQPTDGFHKTEEQLARDNKILSISKGISNQFQDLLDYSRISLGQAKTSCVEFDFKGVIHSVFFLADTLRLSNDVQLIVHLDQKIPSTMWGDPAGLTQTLMGLLGFEMSRDINGEVHLYIKFKNGSMTSDTIEFTLNNVPNGIVDEPDGSFANSTKPDILHLELIKETIKNMGGNILIFNNQESIIRFKFEIPFIPSEIGSTGYHDKRTEKNSTMKTTVKLDMNLAETKSLSVKINRDLSILLQDCMGDVGHLEELVRHYKQNAIEFIGAVSLYIQNVDMRQIKMATRKIKSALAMMGTEHLKEIVAHIHNLCDVPENIRVIENLKNCFVHEFLAMEEAIDKTLEEMKNR